MKLTAIILSSTILLAACTAEPPACTKNFFYNDIPGCKEELEKWKAENPSAVKKWEDEQRKLEAEMFKKLFNAIPEGK